MPGMATSKLLKVKANHLLLNSYPTLVVTGVKTLTQSNCSMGYRKALRYYSNGCSIRTYTEQNILAAQTGDLKEIFAIQMVRE